MEIREKFRSSLSKYLPPQSINYILDMIFKYHIHLTITSNRVSKFGDYRSPIKNQGHRISVNGNLNQYAFLITLVHEIAHLTTWEKHKHTVKPHGIEWKNQFIFLIQPLLNQDIFPEVLKPTLHNYFSNPKASSSTDLSLMKALSVFDKQICTELILEDLPKDSLFIFRNKGVFKKGDQLRKRYRCVEISTNKVFLFNPLAPVELFQEN